MEEQYEALIKRLQRLLDEKQRSGSNRLIIALAGPPGSGKSTVARAVAHRMSRLQKPPHVAVISADGFHLPVAALKLLPNAEEALARRGAPWTFDGAAAVDLIESLRAQSGRGDVYAPTFDHALKDPVADGLLVPREVDICIIEGNYLLVDRPPWSRIAEIVDDRWIIQVDPILAETRVARRHVLSGIEATTEAAIARARNSDAINGQYVVERSVGRYDVAIRSSDESQVL